jgi:putative photosynthetic complex assembly protein
MSDAIDAQQFPKAVLVAATCLIGFTMIFAALARYADIGATRLDTSGVVASREVRFSEQAGGAIKVDDAATGREIALIPAAGNGFVGVVLKGYGRDRGLAGIGAEAPYRISTLADGRSIIEDPTSGRVVMLGAFGPDNLKAFSQIIAQTGEHP